MAEVKCGCRTRYQYDNANCLYAAAAAKAARLDAGIKKIKWEIQNAPLKRGVGYGMELALRALGVET